MKVKSMRSKILLSVICITGVILTLVTSLFGVACAPISTTTATTTATTTTTPAEPIRIGVLVPLTGAISQYGPGAKAAVELRLEEAGYKVAGRPIEVFFEDDGSMDPVIALEKAKKLVEVDKVDVIFGPISTTQVQATQPYLEQRKIPSFPLAYHGDKTTWDQPNWYFCTMGGMGQISYAVGQWAYANGYRTANTFGEEFATPFQGVGGFVHGFTDAGGTIVQQQWFPMGTADFGPIFLDMEPADITVMSVYGPDPPTIVKQWYEFGLWEKRPLINLHNDSLLDSNLAQLGDFTIGLLSGTDYAWTIDTPENKKFVAAFKAKFGQNPQPMDYASYCAPDMYITLVEATGGDITPEVIRDALLGRTFDLPAGSVYFDAEQGYGIKSVFITEVKKIDGELTYDVIETFPNAKVHGYYTK